MKGKKKFVYVKNSVITKIAFTFSDDEDDDDDDDDDDDGVDAPPPGQREGGGDDDDDNWPPILVPPPPPSSSSSSSSAAQQAVLNREFNGEFVQGLLRQTYNTFHSCAELGILGLASIKNRRLLKRLNRQKRHGVLSREKRLAPLLMFGAPGAIAGLIISKSRVITPIQKKY